MTSHHGIRRTDLVVTEFGVFDSRTAATCLWRLLSMRRWKLNKIAEAAFDVADNIKVMTT